MNKRRGFVRLAIALAVPYFGFWAFTAWQADRALPFYLDESKRARLANDWEGSRYWMVLVNDASRDIQLSVIWGIFAPIIALIVASIAYWVYRGFRTKL